MFRTLLLAYIFFNELSSANGGNGFEGFSCPSGEVVTNIATSYNRQLKKRIFLFVCTQYMQNVEQICEPVLPHQENDSQHWTITCPKRNYFINGVARITVNVTEIDTLEPSKYIFKCCKMQRKNTPSGKVSEIRIVRETCITKLLVNAGQTRQVEIQKGVIVGAHSIYNSTLNDRTWILTLCQFAENLTLREEAYKNFPSYQIELYGTGPNNKYKIKCGQNEFLSRVDSVFGRVNSDLGLFGTCSSMSQPLLKCEKLSHVTPRTLDDWQKTACSGQQFLKGIVSSRRKRKARRFTFECCNMRNPAINESACAWVKASENSLSDWSFYLKHKKGYVIRGIGAQLLGSHQTSIRIEICRLNGFPSVGHCLYGFTNPSPKKAVEGTFLTFKYANVDVCAEQCFKFPFCESFRYTNERLCHFTFVRQEKSCPPFGQLPDFSGKNTDIWIQCYGCF